MTGEKYYAAVVENKGIFGVGTSEEGALLKAMANISKCAASSQAPFTGAVDVREIDEGLYHYILTVWDGYVTKEETYKPNGIITTAVDLDLLNLISGGITQLMDELEDMEKYVEQRRMKLLTEEEE